ncbi:hypothetical protein FD967_03740 [Polynucleobacter sp. JS-Mosq-20-D10]|uniref:hypothetical protein n=1 Tax=Polynucleobacter sp. JS-Mosq-20-D10 TaxID=2576922 RepID=UPI001BFD47FD|nr:hypothetical protein [Polynucleobacter sp. JS-Mosq-20-D10]QWE01163.1 hypothetical protein FD967_03740 [Polynucleobacter sp. JS-Mosq-20-D10]
MTKESNYTVPTFEGMYFLSQEPTVDNLYFEGYVERSLPNGLNVVRVCYHPFEEYEDEQYTLSNKNFKGFLFYTTASALNAYVKKKVTTID